MQKAAWKIHNSPSPVDDYKKGFFLRPPADVNRCTDPLDLYVRRCLYTSGHVKPEYQILFP